jgi:hypothetical protein
MVESRPNLPHELSVMMDTFEAHMAENQRGWL